jgi:hypothetical protein
MNMRTRLAVLTAAALIAAATSLGAAARAEAGAGPGAIQGIKEAGIKEAGSPAGSAQKKGAVRKATVRKAKTRSVTGTIAVIDPEAGTLTVNGRKGPVPLAAGNRAALDGFRVGDRVTVKYSEGTALSVSRPKPKKPVAAIEEGLAGSVKRPGSEAAAPPPSSSAPAVP